MKRITQIAWVLIALMAFAPILQAQQAPQKPDNIKAKACFEHAIGRAQNLGHLSWELRATEDLAMLLGWEEEHDKARDLLVSVYARFSEGHKFPLLQRVARSIKENAHKIS